MTNLWRGNEMKMGSWLLGRASAAVLLWGGAAAAQTCATYPNTLTNGATADASQVMANFNCSALLGAAHFSAPVDLGSATEKLSLNSNSLGFNRRVQDGYIYDSTAYAYQLQHTPSPTASSDFLAIQVYTPSGGSVSGYALSISGTGDVGVGTVQSTYAFYVNGSAAGPSGWITASDARLKTNIHDISDPLGIVMRLHGVRYEWLPPAARPLAKTLNMKPGEMQIGFIAQDVQGIVPEAVVAPHDPSKEIYGLKMDVMIPILVEAVKEQEAEIADLKGQVAALKAKP